jgi:virginiamycin B lyase
MHRKVWRQSADSANMGGNRSAYRARLGLHGFTAIWVTGLLLSSPAITPAQTIAIGKYPVPNRAVWGITAGPDGALWYTDYISNMVRRISTAGAVTGYALPTFSYPFGITAGPDGALWFTDEDGLHIGRITTTGLITEYPVPSGQYGITTGPDGALWFAEGSGKIGRITTAGTVTEYPLPTGSPAPIWITAGPDGALWFIGEGFDAIGRITTAGVATVYTLSDCTGVNCWAGQITAGPDGAVWFTESGSNDSGGNKIVRITTAGVITKYLVPTPNSEPGGITAGPDGALWFTEQNTALIGRITTAGVITEYPMLSTTCCGASITPGPNNTLWFNNAGGLNDIGEVIFATAGLGVSPGSGVVRTNLTFTGSAFGPNESVQIYTAGVGSAVLATATADAGGSFTVTAPAPLSQYGPRLFLAKGQTSGKLGTADFSVAPRLILNPNVGNVGSTTTALGLGFGSLEQVKIYWNNGRSYLGAVEADLYGSIKGSAALTFTVPSGAAPGSNIVLGKGSSTGAVGGGHFTVQ